MTVKTAEEKINWENIPFKKVFIEFPEELNKNCTKEEIHKMMTALNSDIPVETIKFKKYPNNNLE